MKAEKTTFDEMDHFRYDFINTDEPAFRVKRGLDESVVRTISREKGEPSWMLAHRLKSLKTFHTVPLPVWGPSLDELNLDEIITYSRPRTGMNESWESVPEGIRDTFDRLGIPEAEKEFLGGVGAQFDSEVVYHKVKTEVAEQGVVYCDMETALREHEALVKKHFMRLVPPSDHTFAALHGALWSGGSFVHVPKGVKVSIPLQSYFRLNAEGAGQFEHTLIILEPGADLHFIEGCSAPRYSVINLHAGCVELFVGEGARLRYSTVENWSKNMMNLNTKRARVEKNGSIEWVSGSFGSHISMLYPSSLLVGEGAHSEFTGISFAGKGQILDTGTKVIHSSAHTTSPVNTKSIAKNGGHCITRSEVIITKAALHSKATISCESLMLDSESRSDTIPAMDIRSEDADIGHEARIGRISDKAIFYLMSRGLSEGEAKELIVRGFAEPIAKALPMEYAVEMNTLIKMEMEGSIG